MKGIAKTLALCAFGFAALAPSAFAQLNVPSDGSDGALDINSNAIIDLSLATTNRDWTYNNSGNAGNGVYDGTKWAVVSKYSSINIASNATVTFVNYPTHAPVIWLVQSNVTVNGTVSLDGGTYTNVYPNYLSPGEPGPGGFRGGAYSTSGFGGGYGPGGGVSGVNADGGNPDGTSYGSSYGNPQILPLMGGSGAGAFLFFGPPAAYSGAGGGGAILVVAGGTVALNGSVHALGAVVSGSSGPQDGAIRIVANQIQGVGQINAGQGRVRVEANSISSQLAITPNTVAVPPGATPVIWPATNAPVVTVVSVNGASVPADPLAGVLTSSDVNISTNNAVNIVVQSQNFPPSGSIVVRVTPKYANYYNVNATYQSGTFSNALWIATTTLPNGFCVLQAHATSP